MKKHGGVIVYLYNEGKSLRFIAEQTEASCKYVQTVLKRWERSGESKYQFQAGRKRRPRKNLIELWSGFLWRTGN